MHLTTRTYGLATLSFVIAAAQAWDAGALNAVPAIQLLVVVAITMPSIGILISRSGSVRLGMAASSGLMLSIARVLSSVALPGLTLAAVFPAILILLDHVRSLQQAQR